jgi:hypothetical protein
MFGNDTGNVMQPPGAWGTYVPFSRRNLHMRMARTPYGIHEPQPVHVQNWGRIGVTPNGALISLGGAADNALSVLDKVGTRGAMVLGAGAGLVFSTNRLLGGLVGAGLGYLTGRYLATIIKATVAAQKVVDIVTPTKAG